MSRKGFGNETSLSLYTLHERNLEEGLLYWGLLKWSVSFYKGSVRGT
jgi:hypothetical protein